MIDISLNRSFCQICQNCINKFRKKVLSNKDKTIDPSTVLLTSGVYSLMSCQLLEVQLLERLEKNNDPYIVMFY